MGSGSRIDERSKCKKNEVKKLKGKGEGKKQSKKKSK